MELFSYILLGSYAMGCLLLFVVWNFKFQKPEPKAAFDNTLVSIIVPVRDEADNIVKLLQCIDSQSYDKGNFELIIANDSSEDDTVALVEEFEKFSDLNIIILNLSEKTNNASPKKRAITEAIKMAKGELIITTDGDCTMSPKWITSLVKFYRTTDAYFISSPVSFTCRKDYDFLEKLWSYFQVIEFGSLVGAGACSIKMGSPNMCSGANIAYKKELFNRVGGYEGNEGIASGDDEFLMHKISEQFPDKIQFLKNYDAVVETQSHETLKSFFIQRKRWASKWRFYKNWQPAALAIYVAMVNATTAWAILTGKWELVLLKFSFEFLFLASVVKFFKKPAAIFYIPFTQVVYPFYVFIMAIAAQGKNGYIWKGRKLK